MQYPPKSSEWQNLEESRQSPQLERFLGEFINGSSSCLLISLSIAAAGAWFVSFFSSVTGTGAETEKATDDFF